MNLMIKRLAVAVVALGAIACQQQEQPATEASLVLEQPQQKTAYALGMQVGRYIKRNLDEQSALGISMDTELVARGFSDGLKEAGQLEESEAQQLLSDLDRQIAERHQAQMKLEQEQNTAKGQEFLAANAQREGVTTTESGLQIETLKAGEGEHPAATDTVTVHYTGTLTDGKVFDSSRERNQPATFALNRVIPGWTEGVQLMQKGGQYKLYIPSALAYGERGTPGIPANSVLIFDIELIDIQHPQAAEQAQ